MKFFSSSYIVFLLTRTLPLILPHLLKNTKSNIEKQKEKSNHPPPKRLIALRWACFFLTRNNESPVGISPQFRQVTTVWHPSSPSYYDHLFTSTHYHFEPLQTLYSPLQLHKIRLRQSHFPRLFPAIRAGTMNLTLSKLPFTISLPSKLLSNLALTLDHPFSMVPIIRTSPNCRFVFHSITPLGKRPRLQRSQGDLCHPLQAGRDEATDFNEHHISPRSGEKTINLCTDQIYSLQPYKHQWVSART